MKDLLVVTHVDFWRNGAGHRSRLSALLHYLKDKFFATVVYCGVFTESDHEKLLLEFPGVTVVPLEPTKTITYKEHGELFRSFIVENKFDVVLIEYVEMSFVLPMINENTMMVLDTHDLVADRIQSFRENNVPYHGIQISAEEELSIFNCFDKILLIQENDYQKIGSQLGFDRVILVPHAPMLIKKTINKKVTNIGFVASEYMPNVDAINWFINNVWASVDHNLTLNIYGNVCSSILQTYDNVKLHGFVEDLDDVYSNCDIVINPVKTGAGLKIKNMEAMACGLPLITTTHGASGIAEGINTCFLLANTAPEFVAALDKLVKSEELRNEIGANAYAFVERKFSPSACYDDLVNSMIQYQLTE